MELGTGNDEQPALSRMLLRIMEALETCHSHFRFFYRPISTAQLPDYDQYVPKEQAVCFRMIQQKAQQCTYTCVDEFLADVMAIYSNACAYNSPGAGDHAYEPVIHWAHELMQLTDELIQAMQLDGIPTDHGDGLQVFSKRSCVCFTNTLPHASIEYPHPLPVMCLS